MKRTPTLVLGLMILVLPAVAAWEPIGPDGGYLQAMAMEPSDPAVLYGAVYDYPNTYSRVVKTTDRGASWDVVGQINYTYVLSLAVDAGDPNVLYAACRSNVMYRSTDGGQTWQPSSLPYYGYSVQADPFIGGRVYIAGIYLGGSTYMALFVSTDHGATWTVSCPDSSTTGNAYACAVSRVDSGVVYVGGSSGRAYRSYDHGLTWTPVNGDLPTTVYVYAMAENPADPDILICGSTSTGVWRTTDGGTTWSQTGTMLRAYYCDFGASGQYGYAAYDDVYISTDSGATWVLPSPGIRHTYVKGFVVHPDTGEVAYVCGSGGVHRTEDGGTNWLEAHGGMRIAHISTVAVNPLNPDRIYLEVYQNGVYRSSDCGQTWTRCNDFLSCGNICGIGVAPGVDADILFALEGAG